ncbi:MAG: glycosyltransferase [Verrucomicrobiota bacterium]
MKSIVPKISFVIPAYNEAEYLPQTLLTIRRSMVPIKDFDYEIVVCDNNSTDDTYSVAEKYSDRVVHESKQQIAQARNTGASHTSGDWLIFLDADTQVNPRLMLNVASRIRSNRFGAGGSLVEFDLSPLPLIPSIVVQMWNLASYVTGWSAGSFLVCRKVAWKELDGFSSKYYAGEELDFSQRLIQWSKARQLKTFTELEHTIITSSRKITHYNTFELLSQFSLLLPGAMMSQKACNFWYQPRGR